MISLIVEIKLYNVKSRKWRLRSEKRLSWWPSELMSPDIVSCRISFLQR